MVAADTLGLGSVLPPPTLYLTIMRYSGPPIFPVIGCRSWGRMVVVWGKAGCTTLWFPAGQIIRAAAAAARWQPGRRQVNHLTPRWQGSLAMLHISRLTLSALSRLHHIYPHKYWLFSLTCTRWACCRNRSRCCSPPHTWLKQKSMLDLFTL